MTRFQMLALCILWSVTTACSTPAFYQAAKNSDHPGYRDQKLDDKKFRISFTGNTVTPRETVEIYLLYRAAELTLENNFDYFIFTEREVDVKTELSASGMPGPGMYGYGGYGRRSGFPYYGVGVQSSFATRTHYESVAYITLHKGKASEDMAHAFNASEILKNLGPRIRRPPQKP